MEHMPIILENGDTERKEQQLHGFTNIFLLIVFLLKKKQVQYTKYIFSAYDK